MSIARARPLGCDSRGTGTDSPDPLAIRPQMLYCVRVVQAHQAMTTAPSRATKAQLCEILNDTIAQRNTALHAARQNQEQAQTALIVAIVAFCLGLLF